MLPPTTYFAVFLLQDVIPLADDVDPLGLSLPDQLRGRAAPGTGRQDEYRYSIEPQYKM